MDQRSSWTCRLPLVLLIAFLGVAHGERASALSNPDDFCTGNPCTISSNKFVDNLAVVDFGSRDVILTAELDVGTGSATLRAGSFSILHPGRLRGQGGTVNNGGSFAIETVNDILIDSAPFEGAIRLTGRTGGTVRLATSVGSIRGPRGNITLSRTVDTGDGGLLILSSAGGVDLSGDLRATGGDQGGGGTIEVLATGDVNLQGLVDLTGGQNGGGSLDIVSGGAVTLGRIEIPGVLAGTGGIVDVSAVGPITLSGTLDAHGGETAILCGDGGIIDLATDGDIVLNGLVLLNAASLDCSGGELTLDGASVRVQNRVELIGFGREGSGGIVDVTATGSFTLAGSLHLHGGTGGAGEVTVVADEDVALQGVINAYGRADLGGTSGSPGIDIESIRGAVTVAADIDASGTDLGSGGDVRLTGCSVTVNSGVAVKALAAFGAIQVTASDAMTLRGIFRAGPDNAVIDLIYAPRADPPDLAGATFNIPPTLTLDPLMPPCVLCTSGADCADGNLCTDDVCIPATGCQNPPNSNPCNDGNGCTVGDTCSGGACTGAPRDCNDNNSCTADGCNQATGQCTHTAQPAGSSCNDGNACTQTDQCNAFGTCIGTNPVICPALGQCYNPGVCNTLTGQCSSSLPKSSGSICDDGNACTRTDRCDGAGTCVGSNPVVCTPLSSCHDAGTCDAQTGVCSNPPKPPGTLCDDTDVCTTGDSCSGGVCAGTPIPGCVDADDDDIPDEDDPCTAVDWTSVPRTPPNQHPKSFVLTLRKLSEPPGGQSLLAKGLFNPAASASLPIDPTTTGVHLRVEQLGGLPSSTGGVLYEVNLPGGPIGSSPCGSGDGWKTITRRLTTTWKYVNLSGALPPTCAPGSARGVTAAQVKDLRATRKAGYVVLLRARNTTLDLAPQMPITRVQMNFALGAQPSPGVASQQAIDGQCAEAVVAGSPVRTGLPKPFCKTLFVDGVLQTLACKGL